MKTEAIPISVFNIAINVSSVKCNALFVNSCSRLLRKSLAFQMNTACYILTSEQQTKSYLTIVCLATVLDSGRDGGSEEIATCSAESNPKTFLVRGGEKRTN